jgi:hypothetical protein
MPSHADSQHVGACIGSGDRCDVVHQGPGAWVTQSAAAHCCRQLLLQGLLANRTPLLLQRGAKRQKRGGTSAEEQAQAVAAALLYGTGGRDVPGPAGPGAAHSFWGAASPGLPAELQWMRQKLLAPGAGAGAAAAAAALDNMDDAHGHEQQPWQQGHLPDSSRWLSGRTPHAAETAGMEGDVATAATVAAAHLQQVQSPAPGLSAAGMHAGTAGASPAASAELAAESASPAMPAAAAAASPTAGPAGRCCTPGSGLGGEGLSPFADMQGYGMHDGAGELPGWEPALASPAAAQVSAGQGPQQQSSKARAAAHTSAALLPPQQQQDNECAPVSLRISNLQQQQGKPGVTAIEPLQPTASDKENHWEQHAGRQGAKMCSQQSQGVALAATADDTAHTRKAAEGPAATVMQPGQTSTEGSSGGDAALEAARRSSVPCVASVDRSMLSTRAHKTLQMLQSAQKVGPWRCCALSCAHGLLCWCALTHALSDPGCASPCSLSWHGCT